MHTLPTLKNRHGDAIDHTFHPGNLHSRLVLLGHGVTGNKDRPLLVALAERLSAAGWPCLRFSFSGNGQSGGTFTDSNLSRGVEDLLELLAWVPQETSIAYIGHSMGAAAGVIAASRSLHIRALVSLAGMTRTAAFAEREFGALTPGRDGMWDDPACPLSAAFMEDLRRIGDTLEQAAQVHQPWLLIHGTADDVVPIQDGLDAFAAARCEKEWLEIPGAGHSFDETTYPILSEAIHQWLSRHMG